MMDVAIYDSRNLFNINGLTLILNLVKIGWIVTNDKQLFNIQDGVAASWKLYFRLKHLYSQLQI